ncbi:MAG: hypothetical protein WBB67_00255 [bacterium]
MMPGFKDPYREAHNRLRKHAKESVIDYIEALQILLEKPLFRPYMSGPDILDSLEKLKRIEVRGRAIIVK